MARMYPADGPAQDTWSDGERLLYEVLRRDLSDDYHVIHSTSWRAPKEHGRMGAGEADYIIVHPRHGILVVEVRGGAISVDSRAKRWSSKTLCGNNRSETRRITDPLRQGLYSISVLWHYLRQDEQTKPYAEQYRVGYAAWFPDMEWPHMKVSRAWPYDVPLDIRDLASPEVGLRRVYDGIPMALLTEDLSAEAVQAAIDLFTPTFGITPALAAKI